LQLILPGFPCKSPNDVDKTFSAMPDYGEVIAIERLDKLCFDLNAIYAPRSKLTILSDGTTFADVVQVSDQTKQLYKLALRDITVTENIAWADLSSILPEINVNEPDDKLRKALLKTVAKGPRPFEKFVDKVKKDPAQSKVHDKMCSYLYHDINLERFSEQCRDGYLASISEKAYQMMYRGKALNQGIQNTFPNHIRLSVHAYDNAGPKFTVILNPNSTKAIAPWHSVPVRLLNGQFVQLPHSIAKERLLALVTWQGQHWFYLEVDSVSLTELTYQIVKGPKFGLRISEPKKLGYQHFAAGFLQKLSEDFGFVILKEAPIEAQDDLVDFCQPYGDIYHWKFGPVHVVKPELNPKGFVHSIHKTPLHWDLSMLPHSDENVKKDQRFAASTFMLYCKTPPAKGEGQTTLVDSRMALKLAGQQQVNRWKNIDVTYETKMTYFGGDPHTYPLVFEHPTHKDDIFRYQEGSELQMQQFLLSSEQLSKSEFANLIDDVNGIAYHPDCFVEHEW
ncbi:MAG: L-tyrosine/L-tryptophan isonitrile synthase family protein, partial [Psychrosphaera sp.]|nr:L-tyrosine/L-tryptophan isonitrile synthase family protein [Psychrosphaera sp.]